MQTKKENANTTSQKSKDDKDSSLTECPAQLLGENGMVVRNRLHQNNLFQKIGQVTEVIYQEIPDPKTIHAACAVVPLALMKVSDAIYIAQPWDAIYIAQPWQVAGMEHNSYLKNSEPLLLNPSLNSSQEIWRQVIKDLPHVITNLLQQLAKELEHSSTTNTGATIFLLDMLMFSSQENPIVFDNALVVALKTLAIHSPSLLARFKALKIIDKLAQMGNQDAKCALKEPKLKGCISYYVISIWHILNNLQTWIMFRLLMSFP